MGSQIDVILSQRVTGSENGLVGGETEFVLNLEF